MIKNRNRVRPIHAKGEESASIRMEASFAGLFQCIDLPVTLIFQVCRLNNFFIEKSFLFWFFVIEISQLMTNLCNKSFSSTYLPFGIVFSLIFLLSTQFC